MKILSDSLVIYLLDLVQHIARLMGPTMLPQDSEIDHFQSILKPLPSITRDQLTRAPLQTQCYLPRLR